MSFKKNMGSTDRIVRIVLAVILAVLAIFMLTGFLQILAGLFAVIFLVTSTVSFCPLYLPFNLSTLKK